MIDLEKKMEELRELGNALKKLEHVRNNWKYYTSPGELHTTNWSEFHNHVEEMEVTCDAVVEVIDAYRKFIAQE